MTILLLGYPILAGAMFAVGVAASFIGVVLYTLIAISCVIARSNERATSRHCEPITLSPLPKAVAIPTAWRRRVR